MLQNSWAAIHANDGDDEQGGSKHEPQQRHILLAQHLFQQTLILVRLLGDYEEQDLKAKGGEDSRIIQTLTCKDMLGNSRWLEFVKERLISVEMISENSKLEKLYFIKPKTCDNLKDKTKQNIVLSLNRSSPKEKVLDFMNKSSSLVDEVRHHAIVNKHKLSFISSYEPYWRWIIAILTVTLNILMLTFYELDDTGFPQFPETEYDDWLQITLIVLSAFHIFFTVLMVASFMWNWSAVIINTKEKEREEEPSNAFVKYSLKVLYLVQDLWWFYHLIFLICSILGLAVSPAFYCIHLLDLTVRLPTVLATIQAVTRNGAAILLTAFLGVILIYFFSVMGFFWFRTEYDEGDLNEGGPATNFVCDSVWTCFMTTYFWGLRSGGGIGDQLGKGYFDDQAQYWKMFFFSIGFHHIIVILILNMVFGIILNTFGELREEEDALAKDIQTICPICSIDRDQFEYHASGFANHTRYEHSLWNYFFYFLFLEEKDHQRSYETQTENFVQRQRNSGDTDFFPIKKSLSLGDSH